MATPPSKRIPPNQGNRSRGFDRQNFDMLRESQLRDLEAQNLAENMENKKAEKEAGFEQAQNENHSRQAQQAQQDAANRQNIAQQQLSANQQSLRQQQINFLKQRAKQQALKLAQKEIFKKGGGRLLIWIAGSSGVGCLTILVYIIIIGAALVVIVYIAYYLGLIDA